MRSSTLVLLFLISVQAVANMGGDAHAGDTTQHNAKQSEMQQEPSAFSSSQHRNPNIPDSITTVDPKLFSKRHYRSSRVLFSYLPPDEEVGEEDVEANGVHGTLEGPGSRVRRRANPDSQALRRGEYSVCKSISTWVGNKTKATDIKGQEVSVLAEFNINNVVKKQYFFETTCAGNDSGSSGCLGIDSRRWNSYCTNTHTFVRALTVDKKLVAWRYIRINTACVCVLSRKSWRH
ncbi:nerve growth factor [Lepisosteus oculatus]|uniref:Nerve growth factor a (beta polypeptide) n=1 Tax=Lepisosteus oculatus TaxID=7918 RepID=W5NN17_LEPOC|nr:PREDICTED: beta-nerve growth factor [Lepisosteus oculatus]XP_015197627.1 PREDICTED: beta-nerve growth factor [Lepisosteus oculatus]